MNEDYSVKYSNNFVVNVASEVNEVYITFMHERPLIPTVTTSDAPEGDAALEFEKVNSNEATILITKENAKSLVNILNELLEK